MAQERAAYGADGTANAVQIIIATPGRVADLLEKKIINSLHVKMLVLDEADALIQKGFAESI